MGDGKNLRFLTEIAVYFGNIQDRLMVAMKR